MSGLEALGIAANVLAVVGLAAKVIDYGYEYAKNLKNAKADIERLQEKVKGLKGLATNIDQLLHGPNGDKLKSSNMLLDAVVKSRSQLEDLERTLRLKTRHHVMSRISKSLLKWPFEREDFDKLLCRIDDCMKMMDRGLQVDQVETILGIDERMILGRVQVAEGASFDSHAEEHEPTCLQNTRVELLQDVSRWALGPSSKPVMWLNGSAGTGKSTIARTVSRNFAQTGHLGATFFFKTADDDRSNLSRFSTTIAADLMVKVPAVRKHIRKAIEEDGDGIFRKAVAVQWDRLVLQPLVESQSDHLTHPIVVVIDALDECKRDEDITLLIKLFTSKAKISQFPHLRLFLTSRPELYIRLGFAEAPPEAFQVLALHGINDEVMKQDITNFLKSRLAEIMATYNASAQDGLLPTGWPGPERIEMLATMSVPLFIFASTICRFIGDFRYGHPDSLLEDLLNYGTKSQESQLDKTYAPVLDRLVAGRSKKQQEAIIQRFQTIVGSIVLLETPLSIESLANLLGMEKVVLDQLLSGLHSVIKVPTLAHGTLRLFHLSFRDFLLDSEKKETKNPFWIDEKATHKKLAFQSLTVMETRLKQNICSLENQGVPRVSIDGTKVDDCIPAEVRYSCSYWVRHFEQAGTRLEDNGLVHNFFKVHFLHWLEALSIIGKAYDIVLHVQTLQTLTDPVTGIELLEFLQDAQRFTLFNIVAIDATPLQLYSSMLVFAPTRSKVRLTYEETMRERFAVDTTADTDWGDCVQALQGHARRLKHVVFSPDSALVASASYDSTIRIWNVTTGECIRELEDYQEGIELTAPVFSQDSTLILSGALSWKHPCSRVWDTQTGERMREMEDSYERRSELFSQPCAFFDSVRLRTIDELENSEATIKNKDAADCVSDALERKRVNKEAVVPRRVDTSRILGHLRDMNDRPKSAAYSPDLKFVACGDKKTGMHIWDIESHTNYSFWGIGAPARALAFSHDSTLLAVCSRKALIIFRRSSSDEWAKTGQLGKFETHVTCVAFSHDSTLLLTGLINGKVCLCSASTGECLQEFLSNAGLVESVAFSHDAKLVASVARDAILRIWRVALGSNDAPVDCIENGDDGSDLASGLESVNDVQFSPDRKLFLARHPSRARMWSATTGQCMWLRVWDDARCRSDFSPNSALLAMETPKGSKILCPETGETLLVLEDQLLHYRCQQLVFSPDSSLVASRHKDQSVRIWSTNTWSCIKELHPDGGQMYMQMVFSHDSELIALSSEPQFEIWSISSGQRLRAQPIIHLTITHFSQRKFAFSPDSSLFAEWGSWGRPVNIWRWNTGQLVKVINLDTENIFDMAFMHDSKRLAASFSGGLWIWDALTGVSLHAFETRVSHRSLRFASGDSRLLTDVGAFELWNPRPSQRDGNTISMSPSGYGIDTDRSWITWNDSNVFHLPMVPRHSRAAISDSTVMFYDRSKGTVAIFNFSSAPPGNNPISAIRIVNLLDSARIAQAR